MFSSCLFIHIFKDHTNDSTNSISSQIIFKLFHRLLDFYIVSSTNYDFLNSTNWNLSLCKAGINPYNYFNLEVLTQLSVFCNFSILECQCKSAFSIFIKAKNVKLRKNQFRYSQFYLPQYLEKHCHVLPGAWSGQTPL